MLKAVLMSVILIAGFGVGRGLANLRKRRLAMLSETLAAMRVLRLRMLNSLEPLGILMRKSDSSLFRKLSDALWSGKSVADGWEQLRAQKPGESGLEGFRQKDLELMDGFFQKLGTSGRDAQNQLFSAAIADMEEMQRGAQKQYLDASRIYTAMGGLIGIAVCVLIV